MSARVFSSSEAVSTSISVVAAPRCWANSRRRFLNLRQPIYALAHIAGHFGGLIQQIAFALWRKRRAIDRRPRLAHQLVGLGDENLVG